MIHLAVALIALWGIEQFIGRRVERALSEARADLNDALRDGIAARDGHIAALKDALELSEFQVLLLKRQYESD